MSIHERIREIRQALGLSQAKFSKDISISRRLCGRAGTWEPAFQDYVLEQTDRLLALQNRRAQEDRTQNN